MTNTIIEILKNKKIKTWRISKTTSSSLELFFVKKEMVMRRSADSDTVLVTVFREFKKDGRDMLGHADTSIPAGSSVKEIEEKIEGAYFAASFVCNPFYSLPNETKVPAFNMNSSLFDRSQEDNLKIMSEALFAPDNGNASFINSAEIFAKEITTSILCSTGTDVQYTKRVIDGEFVVQCKAPNDVESYCDFYYEELSPEALSAKVSEALAYCRDRAVATEPPKAGNYDIIITGQDVRELLSCYTNKASASAVYAGYSDYKVGNRVHTPDPGKDQLIMTLTPTDPFSNEGIPMESVPLVTNGILNNIHGASRFSFYLGIPALGAYRAIRLPEGNTPFSEMKKKPYLQIVTFSGFEADYLSGHFGGEIRLAYYFDGEKVTPVTGGSVNGILSECSGSFLFSKETTSEKNYNGPLALRIENIPVAGK